ncbi:hypothetical protein BK026_05950 [Alteromonas sp. V450]|uniref:hypothetical protein n=1 Tax=Alteromonas sp. V450 TaxID=1912139 RepID=UPI0008FF2E15|nr:hypothetical protein [Alteromonas sp. V450]OJF68366.1 hypothetical protein BK026_05950 [Alteromonas sp. V450]
MNCINRIRISLVVTTFSFILTACGGGGGGGGSTPVPVTPPPAQSQPDPTITVTQENSSCEVSKECLVLSAQASERATGATLSLGGVDSAEVDIDGERVPVETDGTVTFTASQSFKLYVTHSVGETLTLGVDIFIVNGTAYSADTTADVEFTVPLANARLDLLSDACGVSTCNGTLLADTPIDGVNFSLDTGVTATIQTKDGEFSSGTGRVRFPATNEAQVIFSASDSFPFEEFSVQQVSRLTENTFDSVTVSGNTQSVGESLMLSFERATNINVRMFVNTIYGGADVTTDPSHEVKGIKQVVQFGPGITPHRERVVLENVAYRLLKWNNTTEEFDVLHDDQIGAMSGLTEVEAQTLAFNVDTTPWVYRLEVTATLPGGDILKDAQTFVKRDEFVQLFINLFPSNISAERVDEIYAEYNALEDGAEFSSTLANLFPGEYLDEFGNLEPSPCYYRWELEGMFPSMSSAKRSDANGELNTYCSTNWEFNACRVETESSMVLSISSEQNEDITPVDYALPTDFIYVEYEAPKGSSLMDWRFHSFSGPQSVFLSYGFMNNTAGGTIEFDVGS